MAVDFSKFENMVDTNELQKQYNEAPENSYEDVPSGKYIVSVEKMEIKETKDGKKLMFAAQFKIKEDLQAGKGEKGQKGRYLFFNRVVCGNTSPNWTDGMAIKSVVTFCNKMAGDQPISFYNLPDLSDQILELFQDIKNAIEIEVEYDASPKAFNPISFKEDDVYDLQ